MKYLLFSVLLLSVAYVISSLIVFKTKSDGSLNTKFLSYDISNMCKGLSILIIMLSHIGNRFGIRYLTPLGSLGVAVFLFLSGYGLLCSFRKKGLKNYWKNRITAAYIPYAVVEIIGILLQIGPNYRNIGIWDIVKDLLLIDALHPFGWYMQCLFIYYIAFYIAVVFSKKKEWIKYIVLFFTSAILFAFFKDLFKQQVFSFILGVWVAEYFYLIEKKTKQIRYLILAFILGGGCLSIKQISFVRTAHWAIYNLIFALQVTFLMICMVLFVYFFARKLPHAFSQVLIYVGNISYELYLYHGFVLALIAARNMSFELIAVFFITSFAVAVLAYMLRLKLLPNIKRLVLKK